MVVLTYDQSVAKNQTGTITGAQTALLLDQSRSCL